MPKAMVKSWFPVACQSPKTPKCHLKLKPFPPSISPEKYLYFANCISFFLALQWIALCSKPTCNLVNLFFSCCIISQHPCLFSSSCWPMFSALIKEFTGQGLSFFCSLLWYGFFTSVFSALLHLYNAQCRKFSVMSLNVFHHPQFCFLYIFSLPMLEQKRTPSICCASAHWLIRELFCAVIIA